MVSEDALRKLGFSDEVIQTPKRLITSIEGREKTGRTHFSLTAPEPVVFFDIDIGTEGVVEKFQELGKQIFVYTVRVPKGANKDVYSSMWQDVKVRIDAAYGINKGTLVLDTATEAWELARLAHFGKLSQVLPHNYVEVNNEWREVMRLAYDSDMNTVLIHKVKAQYINNVRTGEYETAGFGETGYMVQANLVASREDTEQGPQFTVRIKDCRQNPNISGVVLRGPMVDFGFLLQMVHG